VKDPIFDEERDLNKEKKKEETRKEYNIKIVKKIRIM